MEKRVLSTYLLLSIICLFYFRKTVDTKKLSQCLQFWGEKKLNSKRIELSTYLLEMGEHYGH